MFLQFGMTDYMVTTRRIITYQNEVFENDIRKYTLKVIKLYWINHSIEGSKNSFSVLFSQPFKTLNVSYL